MSLCSWVQSHPWRESLPAAWSCAWHHGGLQCSHGVTCTGLVVTRWSSLVPLLSWSMHSLAREKQLWLGSSYSQQCRKNSSSKLKPPLGLCKQKVFFHLVIFGSLPQRQSKTFQLVVTPSPSQYQVPFPHTKVLVWLFRFICSLLVYQLKLLFSEEGWLSIA